MTALWIEAYVYMYARMRGVEPPAARAVAEAVRVRVAPGAIVRRQHIDISPEELRRVILLKLIAAQH